MARPESIASGGYFATPRHLIPLIARHLTVNTSGGTPSLADPCAGDGEAVYALREAMDCKGRVYTCELEARRYARLLEREDSHTRTERALHGDAFNVEFSQSIGLMFLNPPYDIDPEHGRLEQRYLERFTLALCNGGVLVFIVPYYALAASAETLATLYEEVECYRFPKEDFAAFKQVVVFASKTRERRLAPDGEILARVTGWAKSVARCPVLGSKEETHTLPGHWDVPSWRLREFDLRGLIGKIRPWQESRRGSTGALAAVPHVLPEIPVEDLLFRTFTVDRKSVV